MSAKPGPSLNDALSMIWRAMTPEQQVRTVKSGARAVARGLRAIAKMCDQVADDKNPPEQR